MLFSEIKKDLFLMPDEYCLAHCISADAKMGAGIAVLFRKHFNLSSLQEKAKKNELMVGKCYRVGRVLNLVTKPKYWNKPTYDTCSGKRESGRQSYKAKWRSHLALTRL